MSPLNATLRIVRAIAARQTISQQRRVYASTLSSMSRQNHALGPRFGSENFRAFCTMPQSKHADEAVAFVVERGHREKVAKRIVATLLRPGTGITTSTVLATVKAMAGAYEIGEDAGLNTMAQAVELELARAEGKKVITFHVQTPRGGSTFECQGYEDMSLQDVVEYGELENNQTLQEYIECACSGIMACSTCHVVIDPEWYEIVGSPSEEEQDMIDLAFDPQPTSRLGCQVVLTDKLDGMKLTIPDDSNNLMDHIPFKD